MNSKSLFVMTCLFWMFGSYAKADNVSVTSAVLPITGGPSQLTCAPACGAGQASVPELFVQTSPEAFSVGQYTQLVSGSADASGGVLKVEASNSITCSGDCSPTSIPATVGNYVGIQTDAEWGTDISLGTEGGTTADLIFNLDGTLAASPGTSTVFDNYSILANIIQGSYDSPLNSIGVLEGLSSIDTTIDVLLTPPDPSQPFTADIYLFAKTGTDITPGDALLSGASSSSVDFSDTMQLTGTQVLDANGAAIPGATVNFLDGNPLATPEPSSIALLGVGLLALGIAVRRKRQNAIAA